MLNINLGKVLLGGFIILVVAVKISRQAPELCLLLQHAVHVLAESLLGPIGLPAAQAVKL